MSDLNNLFRPLVVRASAGSGKTFQLSSRFIGLLAAGEDASKILATTFTRKAAGEIQARVLKRLAEAASDAERAKSLAKELNQSNFTQLRARVVLKDLVRAQHRLNISTLDSFFFKIASSFQFELGLGNGWHIEDESERDQIIQEAVRGLCEADEGESLLNLFRQMLKGQYRIGVNKTILNALPDAYQTYLEASPEAWGWFKPQADLSKEVVERAIEDLGKLQPPLGKSKPVKPDKRFADTLIKSLGLVKSRAWEEFVGSGIAAKIAEGSCEYYTKQIPAEYLPVFTVLLNQARASLSQRLSEQTTALYKILQVFDHHLQILRSERGSLGFDDVKRLVAKAAYGEQNAYLYYRLDSRTRHLLLDEFQDTSGSDWKVIEPLADEILSEGGGENSFFCVGDTKQAIYGWRGGVAEIFDALEKRWPQLEAAPSLNTSRRSAPAVIEVINNIFGNLNNNEALNSCPTEAVDWTRRFENHSTALTHAPGYVELLEIEEEGSFAQAAEQVRDLVQCCPGFSIGVLFRRNQDLNRFMFELGSGERGIKASQEGGSPLIDSPAVTVLLNLLRLCDHPGDSKSQYLVAQSPIGAQLGVHVDSDQEALGRICKDIRESIFVRGLGVVLAGWSSIFAPHCSDRDRLRMSQLVELGLAWQRPGALRLMDFVRQAQLVRVEAQSTSPVRVMTIHAAKGLEFDIVVLPALDVPLVPPNKSSLLTFKKSPTEDPLRVVRASSKEIRSLFPELLEMEQQQRSGLVKESLSLLYVALTRARHGLYLTSSRPAQSKDKKPKSTWASLLFNQLAPESKGPGLAYQNGDLEWFKKIAPRHAEFSSPELPDPNSVMPGSKKQVVGSRKVTLAKSPANRRRSLARQSPSGLEGGTSIQINQLLSSHESPAFVRGRMLHWCFEQIEWIEKDSAIPDLERALKENFPEAAALGIRYTLIVDEFHAALKDSVVRDLLSYEHQAKKNPECTVLRERSFAMRKDNSIMQGIFDRVVLSTRKGKVAGIELIDFKTDQLALSDAQALESRAEFYKPQLVAYREILSRMYGVSGREISAHLLFIGHFTTKGFSNCRIWSLAN